MYNLGTDRGASEVVGVALLIGIVILGVTAILLIGGPQFTQAKESVETRQAEQALVQFDSAAARVASGGTTTQRVDLGLRVNQGTLTVTNDTGHITVTYANVTSNGSTELLNTSLGTVRYENGQTSVAYQGGGVWRSDGAGATMVSPPEISYRGETLTMPIIRTRGGSVYSELQVVRSGAAQAFPGGGLSNKLTAGKLTITIRSRYYRAWGAYFSEEIGTVVRYDDANQEVSIIFFGFPDNFAPDAGIIATSGTGAIRLEGTNAYIDSYNSSEGPYTTGSAAGIVEAAGYINMTGNSKIDGDVRSGEDVTLGGSSRINGNVTAKGAINNDGTITGDTNPNGSYVVSQPPIDQVVNATNRSVYRENDNAQTPVITDKELDVTAANDTLGPGRYYVETFDIDGQRTLTLNVTSGDITLVVQDWMQLQNGDRINVQGNETVKVVIASQADTDESIPGGGQAPPGITDGVHFVAERNASVTVPSDDSSQFQIYAPAKFDGAIAGSNAAGNTPHITATIVAPAGRNGTGQVYVHQGNLYGAVVTGRLTLGQNGQVHFDRGLLTANLPLGDNFARLDYLYLSRYDLVIKHT